MQRLDLNASNTQSAKIKAVTHEVGHRGGWVIHSTQGWSHSHGTRVKVKEQRFMESPNNSTFSVGITSSVMCRCDITKSVLENLNS